MVETVDFGLFNPEQKRNMSGADYDRFCIAGEVAASLAHEIRNPATSIKGFLQMLIKRENLGNPKRYYKLMIDEINQINNIISELLLITKPEASQFSQENLHFILKQAVLSAKSYADQRGIKLFLNANSDFPKVKCVKEQVIQVFSFLLQERIDAIPDGGTLQIEMKLFNSVFLKVVVTDQGSLIDPEILSRMGEPFYSPKIQGTGINLMIFRSVMNNHNGFLNIRHEENKKIFELIFPISS